MLRRTRHIGLALSVAGLTLTCAALALGGPRAPRARAASAGALRSAVAGARSRERSLSAGVARLGALVDRLDAGLGVLERREAEVQSELRQTLAQLALTRAHLAQSRVQLALLQARLARDRAALAHQLRAQYQDGRPELVDILISSHSFSDLLDRVSFLRRVSEANARVLDQVRRDRDDTQAQIVRLGAQERQLGATAVAVARQRQALAVMQAAAARRRAQAASARAAQQAVLRRTAAGRRRAERALSALEADRQSAGSTSGPSGPWAIPWSVVQCESGGQDLPPNGAGASGYYQFLDSTWQQLGGSTPHAYQAPKSEQDRLAAKLWSGGGGAGNWVCAGLRH
ncbi:MAG: hypothetical protein E6G56_08825 [Actinobacteria bacterium]|nr:MAG: hypothetical protein E6G56_08825 [Actinomycetota bacterium]